MSALRRLALLLTLAATLVVAVGAFALPARAQSGAWTSASESGGWSPWRTRSRGETRLFGDVYVAPDETVDGDLDVVFGNAVVAGRVRGDVNTVFGSCTVEPGAVIDGEQHCVRADGLRALVPWVAPHSVFSRFAEQDRHLWTKLAASLVSVLVFLLFPLRTRIALARIEQHPGIAAAGGVIAVLAVVPLAIVLLVSIVGIPLIALEICALVAGVWLGTSAVALLVGRRLWELLLPHATPSPLAALVLGLVVVSAAEIVPVVGWVVTALVWLIGLGAAILAFLPSAAFGDGPWPRATARAPLGGPPMTTR